MCMCVSVNKYVCVCVCSCTCMSMWCIHAYDVVFACVCLSVCICMQRTENDIGCLPISLPTLSFRTQSLPPIQDLTDYTIWPVSSGIHLSQHPTTCTRFTDVCDHANHLCGAWDVNSGYYAFVAGTLPNGPSPQALNSLLLKTTYEINNTMSNKFLTLWDISHSWGFLIFHMASVSGGAT